MEEKLMSLKAAIAAVFSALAAFMGWQGIIAIVWVAFVAADWISGTWVARQLGNWSSATARAGALHKAGMLLVILVSWLLDLAMSIMCTCVPIGWEWPWLVCPLVLAWYILTEFGSILENVLKLGAAVPPWLVGISKAALKILNATGDHFVDQVGEDAATLPAGGASDDEDDDEASDPWDVTPEPDPWERTPDVTDT